jgi:formylglycine-generating enzyme
MEVAFQPGRDVDKSENVASPTDAAANDMIWIPERTFEMGSDRNYPEEAPAHPVKVDGFWVDADLVTNRQFAAFVKATGHVTVAEKVPDPKDYPGALPNMLRAGSLVFTPPKAPLNGPDISQWWSFKFGANWRHPYGGRSDIRGKLDHPVVHVAFADAKAYAEWAGKDLPTEAEWELAARGGLDGAEFAWGNELSPDGKLMANTWQGTFPTQSSKPSGLDRTTPIRSFPPNGYGAYDMIGNVWEWTTDWYAPGHPQPDENGACCGAADKRSARERSYDPTVSLPIPRKVIKGGSFLCAPNYCRRYRPAARMAQAIDTSTCHLGFRCVVREP